MHAQRVGDVSEFRRQIADRYHLIQFHARQFHLSCIMLSVDVNHEVMQLSKTKLCMVIDQMAPWQNLSCEVSFSVSANDSLSRSRTDRI